VPPVVVVIAGIYLAEGELAAQAHPFAGAEA
jgi:hypothetical protein